MDPHVATGTFEQGQSNLDVETANSLDLSLGKTYGSWQWNMSLFANYMEDFIFLQGLDLDNDGAVDEVDETGNAAGEFQLLQYQQDNVVMYGFEASFDSQPFFGKLWPIRFKPVWRLCSS